MHMKIDNPLGAFATMLVDRLDQALEPLSPSAAALLLIVHHNPGLGPAELAAIGGIAQPTATRVLNGLEAQGLIARGDKTGRTTPIHPTDQGRRAAERMLRARAAVLESALAPLSPAERDQFLGMVNRLAAAATPSRAAARHSCRFCDHETCRGHLCPIGSRATEIERGQQRSQP